MSRPPLLYQYQEGSGAQYIHICNESDYESPLDPVEDDTFILRFEPRLMQVFYDRAYRWFILSCPVPDIARSEA
jgi:hypothetical protein